MIVRSLDINGDWNFGRGKNDYLRDKRATTQNIATRVRSILGDCFFDEGAGIDWFNLLGSKNQIGLDFNIRTVILNTQNVSGLTVIGRNYDPSTRMFTPSYLVNTVYDQETISISGVVLTNFLLTELGDILTTEDGSGIGL